MIPEYTDEELLLFADAYSNYGDPIDLDRIKAYAYITYGILHKILSIPFEDLPLHLCPKESYRKNSLVWYTKCIAVRLRIGR